MRGGGVGLLKLIHVTLHDVNDAQDEYSITQRPNFEDHELHYVVVFYIQRWSFRCSLLVILRWAARYITLHGTCVDRGRTRDLDGQVRP